MDTPRRAARWLVLALVESLLLPPVAWANPAGGVVHGGEATITGEGTSVVDVNQRSQGALLSWQSFDIQPGEATNFHQPNAHAVAINRILDGQASQIFGALNANGHVYLINPNGILFGRNAVVNVGALTAATSVKAGDLLVFGNGFDASAVSKPGARIENQGTIRTGDGGFVYLVAPEVENGASGVIVSPKGDVMLAAGATVYLTDRPDGLGVAVEYTAPGAPGDAAVNLGKVMADGGLVRLRADLVRQAGVIEANAVREQGGRIELVADGELTLADGSVTAATGGDGVGPGGTVIAKSDGDATVAEGSTLDVSGGAEGGAGGSVEVSGAGSVSLSGTIAASGHAGAAGGSVVIDPNELLVTGSQTFQGASTVSLAASRTVSLQDNASISLTDPVGTPTLDVRSGGDIVFGNNTRITEGAGGSATDHWNVQLLAGAQDLTDPTSLAIDPSSNGGIYLSGAVQDTSGPTLGRVVRNASGEATPLGKNGLVSLAFGDLLAYAAGDVWIGNGGGLVDQVGDIDVQAGRDVRFTAGSTTQDGVIQNGSGDIHVVAGRSVILSGTGQGNAAIRTRGVPGVDAAGNATMQDGGSIFVQAVTGDVDAGLGNRWVQPGPRDSSFPTPQPTDPTFDVLPVVSQGILGIGTEVGGDVTVIAGRDVLTGRPTLARTGGSAHLRSGTGDYTGSHIGLFGGPVETAPRTDSSGPRTLLALDPVTGQLRTDRCSGCVDLPASRLLVIAGGDITGDYMVRQGRAVFRAGYGLKSATVAESLSADELPDLAASLERSSYAADPARGWWGTLARPVTVDLMEGRAVLDPNDPTNILQPSVDVVGANGIALRAIENPSLVYPPNTTNASGTFRVPSYAPSDSAILEAETGDVVLVGNDTALPVEGNFIPAVQNDSVWMLPPTLAIVTHSFTRGLESRGGDLVVMNPFMLFPSSAGGLSLHVAGTVRSPNQAAVGAPVLDLAWTTTGTAIDQTFSIPGGTELLDPQTGLRFRLQGSALFQPPRPSLPATGSVVFRLASSYADQSVLVPAGTRISDDQGRIFDVTSDTLIPDPSGRRSQGTVTFQSDFSASQVVLIPQNTVLLAPDGTQFRTTQSATLRPGQNTVSVGVQAATLGHDAPAFGLALATPISGIAYATNVLPTVRLAQASVGVRAEVVGFDGYVLPDRLNRLVDAVPGVFAVFNTKTLSGTDALATGQVPPASLTTARSELAGPAAEAAIGHSLVLVDPSVLPAGVNPSDVTVSLGSLGFSSPQLLQPVVFRQLEVVRNADGEIVSTRVDPPRDEITLPNSANVWTSRGTPGIRQSEADPGFDARGRLPFTDYARYYRECRSGVACPIKLGFDPIGVRGDGPTHAGDRTPAILWAEKGFDDISIDLVESVALATAGDLHDLRLRAQNNDASDATVVYVPTGDASFGGGTRPLTDNQTGTPITVNVPGDPSSGIVVSGPGTAAVVVGVVPFTAADTDGNGFITPDEFPGSADVFDSLDRESVVPDHRLSPTEAPFVPTGKGGALSLPDVSGGSAGGIETVGNNADPALPAQGASLLVVSAGDLLLGSRGSIGTLEGGDVLVSSISGRILGGVPPVGTTEQRGIFTFYTAPNPNGGDPVAQATGGGAIFLDAYGDVAVGGLAVAALSGSDITIRSRSGDVNAGVSAPFSQPAVHFDPASSLLAVSYKGGGIAATPPGKVAIYTPKGDVYIGSGITGAGIVIHAKNVIAGVGGAGIQSTKGVDLDVSGTVTGNISGATGVNLTGGGKAGAGASFHSSGGIVSGAGAVGSNTVGAMTSVSTNLAGQQVAQNGSMVGGGFGSSDEGAPRQGVRIEVSSQPCAANSCQ